MQSSHSFPQERSSINSKQATTLRAYTYSTYTTSAIVVSFMPLLFLEKGFTESQIGILYATGPFIAIFANIIMGIASDKFQTIRKLLLMMFAGQFMMITLLMPTSHFTVICFIMMGFYFFQTPLTPLSDSLILHYSKQLGIPYALIRIFGSLGFAVSALVFGFLLKQIGTEWTLPILLCTIFISFLLAIFLKDHTGSAKKIQFSGFFRLLAKRKVLLFFFILYLVSVSHRMYESFLTVTLRHMGASSTLIGMSMLIAAASEIPILYLLGKYGHKFKELPLLVFASIMYAVRLWLLGQLQSPEWIVASQLLNSVSFAIYFTSAMRYIIQLIPDQFRTSGQALYAIIWTGLAGLTSGLAGGFIYEHLGKLFYYNLASVIAIIAAIGFLLMIFMQNKFSD